MTESGARMFVTEFNRRKARKSNRLSGFDYSKEGYYFVTICSYQRSMFFGDVINGRMVYNSVADAIKHAIEDLPSHYENVCTDEWCIMPNHLHLLIHITQGSDDGTCSSPRPSLGNIVRGLKAAVSRATGMRVWQRNYHDHIVGNASELEVIRAYIRNNPADWERDRHNPANPKYHEWRDIPADTQRQSAESR